MEFLKYILKLVVQLVPQMLGSLETSTIAKNNLQLSLTYDYNTLNSVFEGTKQIDNQTRERVTNSAQLETTYGLTNKFSVTGLFSFINKRRIFTTGIGSENKLSSSGISDSLLLLKYEIISATILNQRQLAVGFGPKIPTGASDVTQNGSQLPADMQFGSGS